MPTNTGRVPLAAPGGIPAAWTPGWRALLETRWQARLEEITELALAYHEVTATGGEEQPRARRLLRRVVASRRALADTEDALARLSAGSYGRCEDCGNGIPAQVLAVTPETRYCPSCAAAGPAAVPSRPLR
jgi:RNA polymerase-binding transcription factor